MRKVVAVGDSQQRKMLRALDLELFILIDHTFPLKGRRSRGGSSLIGACAAD